MKYVDIYKLQNDGEQKVIVTCRLDYNGLVVCEGNPMFIKNLEEEGIFDYADIKTRHKIFPKDGIKFLENLKHAFRSGYLVATNVQE